MPTFGLLFLIGGSLLIRQVIVGRVGDIPSDTRDAFTALLNQDIPGVSEVLARRGEPSTAGGLVAPPAVGGSNSALITKMQALGSAAKGYRLGAEGPDYYDCSGIVWRAMTDLGMFKGARFTTTTFASVIRGSCTRTATPQPGDIVVWPTYHMGVVVTSDTYYSARSTSKGIGMASLSGDNSYFKVSPEYWRVG